MTTIADVARAQAFDCDGIARAEQPRRGQRTAAQPGLRQRRRSAMHPTTLRKAGARRCRSGSFLTVPTFPTPFFSAVIRGAEEARGPRAILC